MHRWATRASFVLVTVFTLAACGLKGPLYIPTEKQLREQAERERLLQEREAQRKESLRERAAVSTAPQPPPPPPDDGVWSNLPPPRQQ